MQRRTQAQGRHAAAMRGRSTGQAPSLAEGAAKAAKRTVERGCFRIAECLKTLDHCDARCVLRVSRLGHFGLDALQHLESYLERNYGPVVHLLPMNRPQGGSEECTVTRNAFVVMLRPADAQRALAKGEEHELCPGSSACLRRFQRRGDGGVAAKPADSAPLSDDRSTDAVDSDSSTEATVHSRTWSREIDEVQKADVLADKPAGVALSQVLHEPHPGTAIAPQWAVAERSEAQKVDMQAEEFEGVVFSQAFSSHFMAPFKVHHASGFLYSQFSL